MDSESFVAAVVQAAPVFLDRERSVEKAVALIKEAASEGASLVAFPEAWIPGYPSWIYHAAGWNEPRSKRTFARLQRNAVQVPGSATDALCRAAREAGVHLVVGISELDGEFSAGTIYNSLLFVSDEGAILGVHRKLVPTHAERIVWGRGDGSTLHVFDTRLGRLGGLICWEHWMPLTRFAMHAKGIGGGEAIVYGEIDLGRIAEEQQALDVAGHYNRPDVFRLTVDERPQRHVDWLRADGRAEPTPAELERAETL